MQFLRKAGITPPRRIPQDNILRSLSILGEMDHGTKHFSAQMSQTTDMFKTYDINYLKRFLIKEEL
jgi:hypothetical protein